jgi:hypothetical protein
LISYFGHPDAGSGLSHKYIKYKKSKRNKSKYVSKDAFALWTTLLVPTININPIFKNVTLFI